MNDRYLEALEQYEMEVTTVRKGRGAWICETDRGMRLLKEYRGTVRRLEFEDQVLGMLDTRTSLRTDQYERNKEGELLTMAGDGTRYILKEWYGDRECNIRDGCEVRQAIARLAMLHGQLRRIPFKEEWNMGSICKESPDREMDRHIREMQKARNFIRGKRGKTEFELSIMGSYDYFYDRWMPLSDIAVKIPLKALDTDENYLDKNRNIEVKDTAFCYFLHVEEFLGKDQQRPLDFAKTEIKEILINLKRVEFINKVKEELYRHASDRNKINYYYLNSNE